MQRGKEDDVTDRDADIQPPKQPSPGARATPRRRNGAVLLIVLLLITAAFAFVMLSPDGVRRLIAPMAVRPAPTTTISVAPPVTSDGPVPSPNGARLATGPANPPSTASDSRAMPAVTAELRVLRVLLADVATRLGEVEQKTASGAATSTAALESRLAVIDERLAGLLAQPAVTPRVLADALSKNRQETQSAAQDAAQSVAQSAVQSTARQAAQDAVRDNVRKAVEAGMREIIRAVAELEKRVAGLEKMASAVAVVADLERRTASLERAVPAIVAIPDLDRRLAAVEKSAAPLAAIARTALTGESLALGLLTLRSALDRGAPYGDVLSALRAAASDGVLTAEIDSMAASAARGVPTIAMLRQRLAALNLVETVKVEPVKPAQTSAAEPVPQAPAAERGFWAETWHRLGSVVTVRRLDPAPAATTPAPSDSANLVARAMARLAIDDLAAAMAVLDGEAPRHNLTPAQTSALDDWLRDGRARLSAETSFANLSRRSLALHGGASPAAAESPPGDVRAP